MEKLFKTTMPPDRFLEEEFHPVFTSDYRNK